MNWYYARGDERMGPVEEGQFEELVASGVIREDTLVWCEGMADWMPLRSMPREPAEATPGGGMPESLFGDTSLRPCAECGRSFSTAEMVAFENVHVCAACKPVFFQRLREMGGLPGALRFAGFWIRFAARIIDNFILLFVYLLVMVAVGLAIGGILAATGGEGSGFEALFIILQIMNWVFSFTIALGYETWFVGRFGATPGKMVLNLKVVMPDGSPVSYGRALGRYFATILSQLTLFIGYIIAAFDDEKRTLHDHICDTRVVYR